MKIKTTKKLNLPELIQHVWENKVYPSVWRSEESPDDDWTIQFFEDGMFRSYNGFHDYDTFTAEVEEELTEDTELHGATLVYYSEPSREVKSFRYAYESSPTLKHIIQPRYGTVSLAVFRGIQIIWTKDSGIPESGVLEVDDE